MNHYVLLNQNIVFKVLKKKEKQKKLNIFYQKNPKKRRIASIFVAYLAHLLWSGSLFTTPLFFVGMASCLRPERKGEGEAAAPQQEE